MLVELGVVKRRYLAVPEVMEARRSLRSPHTGAVIRFDPVEQPDYIGSVRPT